MFFPVLVHLKVVLAPELLGEGLPRHFFSATDLHQSRVLDERFAMWTAEVDTRMILKKSALHFTTKYKCFTNPGAGIARHSPNTISSVVVHAKFLMSHLVALRQQ